jgi:hypothetical protein
MRRSFTVFPRINTPTPLLPYINPPQCHYHRISGHPVAIAYWPSRAILAIEYKRMMLLFLANPKLKYKINPSAVTKPVGRLMVKYKMQSSKYIFIRYE